MPVRLQFQGLRGQPLPFVFTQMVLAFELMKADPRWVAFNLVQPEDGPVSLADYERQMQMLQFLRPLYPGEHVTLHAGELVAGLAPPADLRFHIRDAVIVAGAERIGHGVDITLERDPPSLLRTMARRHVLVESPLVSNCQILEVCGRRHPIRLYVRSGVPVALATDDEGVSRSDMTDQYEQAAVAQGFGYRALKRFAQDSLRYSFLSDGDKALALRTQRAAFARFEARFPTR
jgi:adenosine deaminase